MKMPLSIGMRESGDGSSALWRCGRNAKKKIGSFRIEQVDQDGFADDLEGDCGATSRSTRSAPLLERIPGHGEQIGDAQISEDFQAKSAGVEDRREARYRGEHVRNDAQRAAEGGNDAGTHTA